MTEFGHAVAAYHKISRAVGRSVSFYDYKTDPFVSMDVTLVTQSGKRIPIRKELAVKGVTYDLDQQLFNDNALSEYAFYSYQKKFHEVLLDALVSLLRQPDQSRPAPPRANGGPRSISPL